MSGASESISRVIESKHSGFDACLRIQNCRIGNLLTSGVPALSETSLTVLAKVEVTAVVPVISARNKAADHYNIFGTVGTLMRYIPGGPEAYGVAVQKSQGNLDRF